MNKNVLQLDTVYCRINKDTLRKYRQKLGLVARYGLTKPEMGSCDGGIIQYTGYSYNLYTNKYRQILIKETGDVIIDNKSPEAVKLYQWLQGIVRNK